MARRLTIGIASYGNAAKLRGTLASICAQGVSLTDYCLLVIHNPGAPDDEVARAVIAEYEQANGRVLPVWMPENVGYAGAVNKLFELAETEYIVYCDNDIRIITPGWDEHLCSLLDRHHEVGMVFPSGGAYQIDRGSYKEILWGVGFCWALNRLCMSDVGPFDESLGHQEEADYAQRVRMAGWRCASLPSVIVQHFATATSDPASIERINRGVVAWVDKWNRYFNGKNFNYHSPNVTRFEDWPPNALYLEEYWKAKLPGLNENPDVRIWDGQKYDLIRVPRLHSFYTNRII